MPFIREFFRIKRLHFIKTACNHPDIIFNHPLTQMTEFFVQLFANPFEQALP